jgi:acetyltransferase-like isoleucine patch superfamily enzyme
MSGTTTELRRKRLANGLYIWAIHLLHVFLDLLPAPLRGLFWRVLLGSCGRGVMIDHRVYFKYPWLVRLGSDVSINRGSEFYPGMMQRAQVQIGDRVRIAPNVRFHAAGHDPNDPHLGDAAATIIVEDDAWIGAAAIILPGVRVGSGAVVAAGSVVNRDVPANVIVGGVPARIIRQREAQP